MARGGKASHLPLRQTRTARAKFQIFSCPLRVFCFLAKRIESPTSQPRHSPWKSTVLLHLARLRGRAQVDFHATILRTASFSGVVSNRLGLSHALCRQTLTCYAMASQIRSHALCAILRQRLVVSRLAGAVRMSNHLRDQLRMLRERLRDLVEHRCETRLDSVAVGIERNCVRNIDLQRSVRLFRHLRARALRGAGQLALDGLPVVAGDAARRSDYASADGRTLAAAEDCAKRRARRRANARANGGVIALLGGATGDKCARDGDNAAVGTGI